LKGAPYNLETFKDLNEEELEDIDSDYSDDESVRIAQRIKAGRKLNSLKIEDDESQTFFCGEVCHSCFVSQRYQSDAICRLAEILPRTNLGSYSA
jgi:hypothetical protein